MCSGPKPNNAAIVEQQQAEAEEARRREDERRARVETGTQRIRDAFSGYDQGYYDRFRGAFLGANQPQLDDQQELDTRTQLFNLARSGNQNSSAAADQRSRIAKGFALQRGQLFGAADDAVAQRRQQVADTQMSLENQLRATEDADLAATSAASQARAIDRTPGMMQGAWLGPLVSSTANAVSGYRAGEDSGFYRTLGNRLFPAGGSSSSEARIGGQR